MGKRTGIQWADATWNPWYGCHKVSDGCKNCYMYREAARTGRDPAKVMRSRTTFNDPLKWKDPARVFTCSWSDFFIEEADEWREEAWKIIEQTPHLTYLILTKRQERMYDWFIDLQVKIMDQGGLLYKPLPNVWAGVTAETQDDLHERIGRLQQVPVVKNFLSIEPMLEPMNLDVALESIDVGDEDRGPYWLEPVDWVIVGGESGPDARPFDPEWARSVIRQCRKAEVPVFVKQLGSNPVGLKLRDWKGADMSEWPEDLRVREFPEER